MPDVGNLVVLQWRVSLSVAFNDVGNFAFRRERGDGLVCAPKTK